MPVLGTPHCSQQPHFSLPATYIVSFLLDSNTKLSTIDLTVVVWLFKQYLYRVGGNSTTILRLGTPAITNPSDKKTPI
jgi:hypothetical protein